MSESLSAASTPGTDQEQAQDQTGPGRLDVFVARYGLFLALTVAVTATLGSLFMSEVLRWLPCNLCWYQRIAMYPLAMIIPLGLLARSRDLPLYTVALSVAGWLIASYHYVYQKTSWFDRVNACSSGASCKGDYLGRGLVTIPGLAWVAFALITLLAVAVWRRGGPEPLAGARTTALIVAAWIGGAAFMLVIMYALPAVRLQWLGN